jgi:beta-glucanase (GH16 family)
MRRNEKRSDVFRLLIGVFLLIGLVGWTPGVLAASFSPQAADQPYTVKSTDTLGSIALAHRITVVSILVANPSLTNPNQVYGGEQLLLPASNLKPGQSIWDGYTGGVPVTGSGAPTSPPTQAPTQAPQTAAQSNDASQPNGVAGDWKLLFDDEFEGTSLDSSHWITAFPWGRTSTTTPQLIYRSKNVTVSDGTLQLIAQKQSYQGYPFTSGIVTTSGKFSYRYGLVEIRARVPAGRGLWPAFWSLPASGDSSPEIDTMEIVGNRTSTAQLHYHYGNEIDVGSAYHGPDFSADWHSYAVDWEPDAITWYVDGVQQNQFTDQSAIATQPMYLIANLQVGGWPGTPDSSTPFPATYAIDYVRVWQH